MIVRNIDDDEVNDTTYRAHGGGIAKMLLTSRELRSMLFLAHAVLEPSRELEEHIDPYEEIYFILSGEGTMRVGNDRKKVKTGDAIWIPTGDVHGLVNESDEDLEILVTAAYSQMGKF